MRILNIAAAILALVTTTCAADAQDWPSRPIRVIIPFAAGSATDTMTRPVLDQLSKQLGQPAPAGASAVVDRELEPRRGRTTGRRPAW